MSIPAVNIWILHIPSEIIPKQRESLLSILSDEERKRLAKMGSKKRQVEYLLNHALVRVKCAEALGEKDPREVPLVFDEGKRPQLQVDSSVLSLRGPTGRSNPDESTGLLRFTRNDGQSVDERQFHLSLSHTKDLVACALSPYPVGIDIEKIREPKQQDAVAKKYFSEEEVKGLNQFEGEQKWKRFYEIWTLKESFYKVTNLSVSDIVKKTSFKIETNSVSLRAQPRTKRSLYGAQRSNLDESTGLLRPSGPRNDSQGTSDERRATLLRQGFGGQASDDLQFHLLYPTPSHVMAVAVQTDEELDVSLKEVNITELF